MTQGSEGEDDKIREVDVVLPLEQSEDHEARREAVAKELGVKVERVVGLRLRKHSIDARQRHIKVRLRLEVGLDDDLPESEPPRWRTEPVKDTAPRVVIVGAGPAGLFAALRCLELGLRPVIVERGKDVSARRFDLAPILRHGTVIEDSNYCFGEGGAGTFSDGKLYTRATKRGPVRKVYEVLVAHGAPERILIDAHPHVGSNLLPNVVRNIRESIIAAGGEVHFHTKITDILTTAEGKARGVLSAAGGEIAGAAVVLATGHSARDIYRLIRDKRWLLEPKPFAIGVRIEHPQPLIDRLQYSLPKDNPRRPRLLPAASYRLATKIEGRGVHSFCMCPGGWIVPAATENDEVVVNGMSLSKRDSPFANSGLVVTVEPEDVSPFEAEHGLLAGMAFQKFYEQAAKTAGGGGQVAPGQRLTDFLKGRISRDLPQTSYHPGLNAAPLHEILPGWIVSRMRQGLGQFGRQMHGYLTSDANLVGFETRTSSPVRIIRDTQSLQHPDVAGLYPCGEGAGYAGGIVSAALDGMKVAEAVSLAVA